MNPSFLFNIYLSLSLSGGSLSTRCIILANAVSTLTERQSKSYFACPGNNTHTHTHTCRHTLYFCVYNTMRVYYAPHTPTIMFPIFYTMLHTYQYIPTLLPLHKHTKSLCSTLCVAYCTERNHSLSVVTVKSHLKKHSCLLLTISSSY